MIARAPAALALLAALAAAALLAYSAFVVDGAETWRGFALLVLAISLFATQALPEHVTAFLIFFLAMVLGIAPANVVFSGFATGGVWLLFSGIIIGAAVGEAGLGTHIARAILRRVELTYARAIALMVAIAILLGFIMPATIPRIIVLLPVAIGLAETMGFAPGGRGYTGLVIAAATGTMLPNFAIMTATLPAVVFVGTVESVYGLQPTYGQFLFYHGPVTGALRAALLIAVLILLFNERPVTRRLQAAAEPLTAHQKRLLAVLCVALAFWVTDFWHHISPAWVSLGTAVVILLPGTRLLSAEGFKQRVSLVPAFYVASLLSMGAIVVHTGVDKAVGALLLQAMHFAPDQTFANYLGIYALGLGMSLLVTSAASPVLAVPLAGPITELTGMGLPGVLMTQLLGISTIMLPYQAPPLIVTLSLSQVRTADMTKACLILAALVTLLGAPINYLWWRAIGLLP